MHVCITFLYFIFNENVVISYCTYVYTRAHNESSYIMQNPLSQCYTENMNKNTLSCMSSTPTHSHLWLVATPTAMCLCCHLRHTCVVTVRLNGGKKQYSDQNNNSLVFHVTHPTLWIEAVS